MDNFSFGEIFDLDELQKLMDALSKAFGIGVGIRTPKGERLISDSHYCNFCREVIQQCELGKRQCEESDLYLSAYKEPSPMIWRCKSAGLIDAGINIMVEGVHIASILVGQVRLQENELNENEYRAIARALRLDEEKYLNGLKSIPVMNMEKFKSILDAFTIIANQLSELGYHNLQQKRKIKELEIAESTLQQGSVQLQEMAEKDALTGLYNRSKFEQLMEEYGAQKHRKICMVSGDANNLKLMNDIFGHEAGDKMLQAIGEILEQQAEEGWLVARCGGDEYRVMMPDTSLSVARDYCENVTRTCKGRKDLNLALSIALGVAEWDSEAESLQECFNRADAEMYEAKQEMKQKENMLDYILDKCFDKRYLYREAVMKAASLAHDFAIHLGFNEEGAENVRLAALYQDVGMIEIPEEAALSGPSASQGSKMLQREHVLHSHAMALHFPKMRQAADIILCAHENWDGYGYPRGLRGQKIPLESRIIFIVNNYAYWITPKPKGSNLTREEAIGKLRYQAGMMYDPDMVEWFIKFLEEVN